MAHKSTRGRSSPAASGDQATLRVVGMPKLDMMFMTWFRQVSRQA
ncbi:hypothetical protein [Azospirillum largimobile]